MFYSAQRERTGEFYMYECERLFGVERGMLIREQIEAATGKPCPCSVGDECPLRRLAG